MTAYNLYLLSADGRTIGKKVFKAVRNYEAIEIAAGLVEAAAERCTGYEVWRGERKIVHRHPRWPAPDTGDSGDWTWKRRQ
jgi:hypothetical protein